MVLIKLSNITKSLKSKLKRKDSSGKTGIIASNRQLPKLKREMFEQNQSKPASDGVKSTISKNAGVAPPKPELAKKPESDKKIEGQKPKLSFPEIKRPEPAKSSDQDVDNLITKIYADISKNGTSTAESKDAGGLAGGSIGESERQLFFEQMEKLFKEERLDESHIKAMLKKDLASRMKHYHESRGSGKPFVFDQEDFNRQVLTNIAELKGLEHEWHQTKSQKDELEKQLKDKELEIDKRLSSLKGIFRKHSSMEKKHLINDTVANLQAETGEGLSPDQELETSRDEVAVRGLQGRADDRDSVAEDVDDLSSVQEKGQTREEGLPGNIEQREPDLEDVLGDHSVPASSSHKESDVLFSSEPVSSISPEDYVTMEFEDKALAAHNAFVFCNGSRATSMSELKESLNSLSYDELAHHINLSNNHFAPWLSTFFPESGLSHKVASLKSPRELLDLFSRIELV